LKHLPQRGVSFLVQIFKAVILTHHFLLCGSTQE
jgi:hypothetical protein